MNLLTTEIHDHYQLPSIWKTSCL